MRRIADDVRAHVGQAGRRNRSEHVRVHGDKISIEERSLRFYNTTFRTGDLCVGDSSAIVLKT
jgi:hypothetical protein